MSVKSIAEAYSKFGQEGLTEKGREVRVKCILGATAGLALIIAGIVTFILLLINLKCNTTLSLVTVIVVSPLIAGVGFLMVLASIAHLRIRNEEYVVLNPQNQPLPYEPYRNL